MTTPTLFESMGGETGIRRLADAWHQRCLADPVVQHAFSRGFHPEHRARVAAYWGEALGGPARYSGTLGSESEVIRMHSGNGEAAEMLAAGSACFAGALTDVGVRGGPLRARMLQWWADSSRRMDGYPASAADVPDGLEIPVWDG
ncbi:oxidoreductase [Actinomycetota bacterium]